MARQEYTKGMMGCDYHVLEIVCRPSVYSGMVHKMFEILESKPKNLRTLLLQRNGTVPSTELRNSKFLIFLIRTYILSSQIGMGSLFSLYHPGHSRVISIETVAT